MKLIVAGSRHLDAQKLRILFESLQNLTDFFELPWPKEVIHGGCKTGADAWCADVMDEYWDTTPTRVFPANWDLHGRAAGPLRNKDMAAYGDVLILLWDGKSPGSRNMMNEMLRLKKPVYEIVFPGMGKFDMIEQMKELV